MSSIRFMRCSINRTVAVRGFLAAAGLCYPFAVYAALGEVPAGAFVLVALALMLGRLATLRGHAMARLLMAPLLVTMAMTLLIAVLDPDLAVKAYPVLMSLCFAGAFGISLLRPPSLVEIMARMRQPALSAEGVRYTRRVSCVWFAFLIVNAALSLATAISGNLALWTLYNGVISYALVGLLVGGEMLVRHRLVARPAA